MTWNIGVFIHLIEVWAFVGGYILNLRPTAARKAAHRLCDDLRLWYAY